MSPAVDRDGNCVSDYAKLSKKCLKAAGLYDTVSNKFSKFDSKRKAHQCQEVSEENSLRYFDRLQIFDAGIATQSELNSESSLLAQSALAIASSFYNPSNSVLFRLLSGSYYRESCKKKYRLDTEQTFFCSNR